MKQMLDLSVFEELTLDIKLPDGRQIKLRKPSQMMAIKLMLLKDIDPDDSAVAITKMDQTVRDILNTNENGIAFDQIYVNTLNIAMKIALIQAYTDFIRGIQADPNS